MAIENALIAKIAGGLVVTSGAGSAGIYYREQIANGITSLFSSNKDYFFIVKATEVAATELGNDETYLKNGSQTTKNFKCKLVTTGTSGENNQFDETCEIYKFTAKDTTSHKLLDLKGIKEAKENPSKADIKADSFFKLKVNKNLFKKETFDWTEKIELITTSTDASKTGKKYGSLQILYKIEENKVVGKTNLIIGKSKNKSTETIEITSGTKCFIKSIVNDTKEECSIYKFNAQPPEGNHKEIVFNTSQLTTPSYSDLADNNLYLIDLKDKKIGVNSDPKTTVIVYEKQDTTKTVIEFDLVSSLSSGIKPFNKDTSPIFFLN